MADRTPEKTTKTKLIFFPDERDLTDAQIEEARLLGHLDESKKGGQPSPGGVSGTTVQAAVLDPAGKLVTPNAPTDAKSGKETK